MREDYKAHLVRREAMKGTHYGEILLTQESRYVHPFQIYGNVWYVGDSWVCVHLVDTGDGLLLIDSGNSGATAMLVNAIWEAGFTPADVKWIIHTHGHVDHIGGSNFFHEMFGTKLYIGQPDAQMFRERPELSMLQRSHNDGDALFEPDYEIKEGEILTFGNTTMTFHLVPGHTEGCLAIFFDAHDGDEKKRCGLYGGFGFNTLQKEYLMEIGDFNYSMRRIYLESLRKVRDRKVEIFLGNHCADNRILERRKRQMEQPDGPNPFVDDGAWRAYLDEKRDALLELMADPANQ